MGLFSGEAAGFEKSFNTGDQYVARTDKGYLNAIDIASRCNLAYSQGYRLHTVFEQRGNTVMVFERRDNEEQ
jgi:hypothetical protein